jgi:hypothetical protein
MGEMVMTGETVLMVETGQQAYLDQLAHREYPELMPNLWR